jgi:hypothetical protein
VKVVNAQRVLDQLEGATIVSCEVQEDDGMHMVLQDGRILVIAGLFALSLLRLDRERLH